MRTEQCLSNLVFSFQDNLRCFGVNYKMSRITHFLCYFLSVKLASVLSYYAFPSLSECSLDWSQEWSQECSPVFSLVEENKPALELNFTLKYKCACHAVGG